MALPLLKHNYLVLQCNHKEIKKNIVLISSFKNHAVKWNFVQKILSFF